MFIAKGFDELTREELYEILRARVDVFVVEQHCPHPDWMGWIMTVFMCSV